MFCERIKYEFFFYYYFFSASSFVVYDIYTLYVAIHLKSIIRCMKFYIEDVNGGELATKEMEYRIEKQFINVEKWIIFKRFSMS